VSRRRPRPGRPVVGLVLLVAIAVLAGACGDDGGPDEVVLVTHDSFVLTEELVEAFEAESGYALRVLQGGDAVEAVNRAVLTAGSPQGDVLFGVDESTLSRALEAELFEPYRSPALDRVDPAFVLDPEHRVTPVDHGAVCVNVDLEWFAAAGLDPPEDLTGLVDPAYADLLVVQNPASSSPGLAFLLASIAEFGEDGWLDWWAQLRANGVTVTSGWTDAYFARFTAGGGDGDRPLVVSYGSSPPAGVLGLDPLPDVAPTGVIESTCYRQVEMAGVLRGAANPDGARALVDFLLDARVQASVPLSMFVFPVVTAVPLPEEFARFAVVPRSPYSLPPETVAAGRDGWIGAWTDTVIR
jgi:thiamine transport system substrate-binding protein